LFASGSYKKITEVAHIFGLPTFATVTFMHYFFIKKGWASFCANFSQTHPVTLNLTLRSGFYHFKLCSTTGETPATNPTIVSYNASAVKFYNATSRVARFFLSPNIPNWEKRTK
jgi:hypothetical protein